MKKKLLKMVTAFLVGFGIQLGTLTDVLAAGELQQPGTYEVPVQSLVSSAPLQPVQDAFAKAFGESVEVTVGDNGDQIATIHLQHMIINMNGEYHANVKTVEGATVLTTRQDVYSQNFGSPDTYVDIEVPETIQLPLHLNEGKQEISLTVDFMDAFLNGGNSYPTTVTLTLDVENAVKENAVVQQDEAAFKIYYHGNSGQFESRFNDKVTVTEYEDGTYTLSLTAKSLGDSAEYTDVEEPENVTYTDHEDGTRTFTFTLSSKDQLSEQHRFQFAYYIKAMDRTNTHEFYLELISDDNVPGDTNPDDDHQSGYLTKDGTYSVNVALWHADQDKESMAAGALDEKATIVVKNNQATMYITTKEMTMGSIKAYLQELYIGSINEDYKSQPATVVTKDSAGNPTMWSFALPHEDSHIDVVVNPHVAMMGNVDLGARIKVDYSTLTYVSDSTQAPETENHDDNTNDSTHVSTQNGEKNNSQKDETESVLTGDKSNVGLMGGLLIAAFADFIFIIRKKSC